MSIEIRPYRRQDTAVLTKIFNSLPWPNDHAPVSFPRHLQAANETNGRAWVLAVNGEVVAYTAVTAVPGLPDVMELFGFVSPAWQRQGLGTRLLYHLLEALKQTSTRQVSVAVSSLDTPAAHFLGHHQFFVEHEEQFMCLTRFPQRPEHLPRSQVVTFPRHTAVEMLISLYDASFRHTPWYQPYSTAEVASILGRNDDIFFLLVGDEPVGMAWVHTTTPTAAEIEPIGIVKEKQRQGYGRFLLLSVLHQLAQKGFKTVRVGVWVENQAALQLYESVGFKSEHRLTYYAYNL